MNVEQALQLFRQQYANTEPYHRWVDLLGIAPAGVDTLEKIPFLPIEFFRNERLYCANHEPELIFTSSGTTGSQSSTHYVASAAEYEHSFTECFKQFYGSPEQYTFFALLPSYLERQGSSLVYMAQKFHDKSMNKGGFFLYDHLSLKNSLERAVDAGHKILLLGVSFALLDFADHYHIQLPQGAIVMETGGMKGRHRELSRQELHRTLCKAFGLKTIHSEYGMCELLSQAYSWGEGIFRCPDSMAILIRSASNPLEILPFGQVGAINIIDLNNRHSCSFIATQDKGIAMEDGSFQILGRMEQSPLRGCNMLLTNN
ncbi:MAG: acyltransferase [Mucinivorans sp.]